MAPKVEHKRHNSKHKIDRRLGCNLWGRPKSPFNTRQTAPGMHGARRAKPTLHAGFRSCPGSGIRNTRPKK